MSSPIGSFIGGQWAMAVLAKGRSHSNTPHCVTLIARGWGIGVGRGTINGFTFPVQIGSRLPALKCATQRRP